MPKYRISGAYWDGKQFFPSGSIVEFPEGKEPPRSKLVAERKTPAREESKASPNAAVKKE